MSLRATRSGWVVSVVSILSILAVFPATADDYRGGEAGVLLGAIASDEDLTGESGSSDGFLGLRGGSVFSRRVGWFVDALYADIDTTKGLGTARTATGRMGFDFLLTPGRDFRWFFSAGGGWIVVDFEKASYEDMHNPLATIGVGQRIRIGSNRLRWELRADHTLDNARLNGEQLLQTYAMLGFVWGPGGVPDPASVPDADRDGVLDRGDRCPDTPALAVVDNKGCPLDDDRDGVPNGIDECERTPRGEQIGADGCRLDSDSDGVLDQTDYCAKTPPGARVDEWGCPTDADLDAVYDGLDECPGTPRGAWVNADGCPMDEDGDGVFDGLDRCPETPAGTAVGPRGCAS